MGTLESIQIQKGINFGALIAELCGAVFLVDVNGNVVYLSGRSAELLGIVADGVLNRPFALLFKEIANRDLNAEQALLMLHGALGKLSCRPHVLIRKHDGKTTRFLELVFFPFPEPQEEALTRPGWGCAIREVTSEHDHLSQRTQALLTVANNVRSRLVLVKGLISTLAADCLNESQASEQEYLHDMENGTN